MQARLQNQQTVADTDADPAEPHGLKENIARMEALLQSQEQIFQPFFILTTITTRGKRRVSQTNGHYRPPPPHHVRFSKSSENM